MRVSERQGKTLLHNKAKEGSVFTRPNAPRRQDSRCRRVSPILCSAGLPTRFPISPPSQDWPSGLMRIGCNETYGGGSVPDFHGIPYSGLSATEHEPPKPGLASESSPSCRASPRKDIARIRCHTRNPWPVLPGCCPDGFWQFPAVWRFPHS